MIGRRIYSFNNHYFSSLKPSLSNKQSGLKMALQTGIVGLPNVGINIFILNILFIVVNNLFMLGKSTLFNALVGSAAAQAANFPFCTIGKVKLNINFILSSNIVSY
jgi:ribosome biogenesis GTPase A